MTAHPYHAKLARCLDRHGRPLHVCDILERDRGGRMQSFAEDNSWVITQSFNFPRAGARGRSRSWRSRRLPALCMTGF